MSDKTLHRLSIYGGNDHLDIEIIEMKIHWGISPQIPREGGDQLAIFQTNGPLDVVYLSSLLAIGCSIDLLLDPGYLSVFDDSDLQELSDHRSRILEREHLTSSGLLGDNIGSRVFSLLKEAKSSGWDLDVMILDPGSNMAQRQNLWTWSDHAAIQIMD